MFRPLVMELVPMSVTNCGSLGHSNFVDICYRHDWPCSAFLDRTKVTEVSSHIYGSKISMLERDLKSRLCSSPYNRLGVDIEVIAAGPHVIVCSKKCHLGFRHLAHFVRLM